MSTIPDFVSDFLQKSKQLQDMRESEIRCKQEIALLQPRMKEWLMKKPSYEVDLKFNEEQRSKFGDIGKLRFSVERRKECLTKHNLIGYLASFFTQIFPQRSNEEIEQLANASTAHVWQSRKTTKNTPVVLRTFSKARKRKL